MDDEREQQGTENVVPTAPEPAPAQALPEELPDKFKGKSAADIAKSYLEIEKVIGKQAEEQRRLQETLDNLQNEMAYQRNVREQERHTAPQVEDKPPKFDYDDPEGSLLRFTEWKERKQAELNAPYEQARLRQEMTDNFLDGRDTAMKANKRLYEGIEKEVEAAVWNTAQTGFLRPNNLRNPETWETAAIIIRKRRGELDRVVSPGIQPVAATPTERPASVKGEIGETEEQVDLSNYEMQKLIKDLGIDEKQAREIIKKERQIAREGVLNTRYKGRF